MTAPPKRQTVEVPYSEAAMHLGIAGLVLEIEEERYYINGKLIPPNKRHSCFVLHKGARHPLLKSEAGWKD